MINALIVDDEKLIREGLANYIPWQDYNITIIDSVGSCDKAMSIIKNNNIHLLITDIKMPIKTGLDLLYDINLNMYSPQTIILSSFNNFEYAQKACSYDFVCGYVLKPFDFSDFKKSLDIAISKIHLKNQDENFSKHQNSYISLLNELSLTGYSKQIFINKILQNNIINVLNMWDSTSNVLTSHKYDVTICAKLCYDLIDFMYTTFESTTIGGCDYLTSNPQIKNNISNYSNKEDLLDFMKHQLVLIYQSSHDFVNNYKTKFIITTLLRIKSEYSNPNFNLTSLSYELNVTPNYLSQKFRDETGVTFTKYLTNFRMDKANEFLSNSNLKIAQIAQNVGYFDEKYFTRVFKIHTGVSPKKYQQKL